MALTKEKSEFTLENLEEFVGKVIGTSGWHIVSQQDVTRFGEVTQDMDPNHIDPEWSRAHGVFGCAVLFGFQSLSLLSVLGQEAGMRPGGAEKVYNYGFDYVRFTKPVPVGARIRVTMKLKSSRYNDCGRWILTYYVELEVEGTKKPALVADWLVMCSSQ